MRWRELIPTFVTMCAMLAGFLSIIVTIQGLVDHRDDLFKLAAQLIMLAMILDGLDGNLARALKGQSEFGAELDTYVDMTAFGIAPAILIFAVTFEEKDILWRILLPSAVCVSGVVRLARFKVKDPLRGQGGYAGLPITANAAWVALFVYVSQTEGYKKMFSLSDGLMATIFLIGIFTFITLQVTSFRYPKPTKKTYLFIPCIILVALLFVRHHNVQIIAALTILSLGVIYIAIGPLFVKSMAAHTARKEAKNPANGDSGANGAANGK